MATTFASRPRDSEATQPLPQPPSQKRSRLEYFDALKVALIVLVVAHHAGQAFGPTGGAWPLYNPERAPILDSFFTVNAAFFMGLFFLLSGYLVPASFERKGPVTFFKERLVRLGTPIAVLLIGGLVYGFIEVVVVHGGSVWSVVPRTLSSVLVDQHLIHFWFLDQLLVFTALYIAWRTLTAGSSIRPLPAPGNMAMVGFALALAAATFIVRIDYPVNRWTVLLGFFTTEVAHLPQYASLFAIGILAYQGQWLRKMPTRTGMVWLVFGVVGAAVAYLTRFGANGGLSLGSLIKSTWEAFVCVGLCVGLLVLFREYVAAPNGLVRMAAPNAYGVYIIHVLLVVPLQAAVILLPAPPLLKFALVVVTAVPLSFALAGVLRRLPSVRAVL